MNLRMATEINNRTVNNNGESGLEDVLTKMDEDKDPVDLDSLRGTSFSFKLSFSFS